MKIPILYQKYRKILIILSAFLLTLIVSLIRKFSGPMLAFTLFYIFPIILATWKTGIWAGIFISFTSALLWLIADKTDPYFVNNYIIPYLNNIFRLIVFLIITYIVSELRTALESQKELARIDPLTVIPNRRAFYETAYIEFEKAKRHGYPISVICMDLDNFKTINDTLGHATGDQLLKVTAKTIIRNLRTIDLAGRLGGDEFGILLPQADVDSAYIVANKIKIRIMEVMQQNKWPVTTSIGVVTSINTYESLDQMIKNADILMYSAKQDGKNAIKQSDIQASL